MTEAERDKLIKFAKFQQKFGFPGVLIILCFIVIYSMSYAYEHVSSAFAVIGIFLLHALINYPFLNDFINGEPSVFPLLGMTCDLDTPYELVMFVLIGNAIWLYMLPIGLIWNLLK